MRDRLLPAALQAHGGGQSDHCSVVCAQVQFRVVHADVALRALGIEQRALQETTDSIFVVADVQLRYLASTKLDDSLRVTVQVVETGAASMVLAQQAWRGTQLVCEGRIRVGCVDAQSLRPQRMPPAVRAVLV